MRTRENWIAFKTILRKEVVRFVRIWTQSFLPSVVTIALYFIIFGNFIGSQIRDIDGFSYMAFIVPGLIMMAVINNSFTNVVSSFFGIKFQKAIEELLVSPVPNYIIILGYSIGGMLRGIIVGILVTIISLFFVKLQVYNIFFILIFIVLTSFMFSLAGLLNGIYAKKFDDVQIFPVFVLTPLIYLGGIFYSINLLPSFWQTISKFNPILYMINGFRYGFLGITDINIWTAMGLLIVFIIILFFLNLHLLNKGVGLKD